VLGERGGSTLLDALAAGHYALVAAWRAWATALQARAEVTQRVVERAEPIWSAAVRALAAGRLAAPARAATVRPDSTYEMDTTEVELFDEAAVERGRPGYR
jgi:urease accessory protein UreF